jgi:lipopolysaccharide/colanic/teichoic acid biosynthesis glycosyltransferase
MTTAMISAEKKLSTETDQNQENLSSYCTLLWRQGQLLVLPYTQGKQPYLPSVEKKQRLIECLKSSPVTLVRIDPKLGESKLKFWADACYEANKTVFLRIPPADKQPKGGSQVLSSFKRLCDWLAALMFVLAVSPIMLGLMALMYVYGPREIFSAEWYVGKRGRLFRMMKFRTTTASQSELENEPNITPVGDWMRKYGLDNLPQLWNVLRGDMSLIGSRCWSIEEAARLSIERQKELNRLPGMTRSWEVEAESNQLHLDSQML